MVRVIRRLAMAIVLLLTITSSCASPKDAPPSFEGLSIKEFPERCAYVPVGDSPVQFYLPKVYNEPAPCIYFSLRPELSSDQKRMAWSAAARWNKRTLRPTCLTEEPGQVPIGLMYPGSSEYEWFLKDTGYPALWGVCYEGGIRILSEVPSDWFEAVVAHELGHCSVGIGGHVLDPALMNAAMQSHIMAPDVSICKTIGSCKSSAVPER